MNCSPAPNQLGVRGDGVRARLDIADALDLVAAGAREPCGIVAFALSMAGVADADLDSIRDRSLRQLYRDGELPIPVTLGALIVLDAAQRSQGRGRAADKVLDDAAAAASRFLDLAPVLPSVTRCPLIACSDRCHVADMHRPSTTRRRKAALSSLESSCGSMRAS